MNKKGKNGDGLKTLCWDCANSTKPDVCPWVRDFNPVEGWEAKPRRTGGWMPFDTYIVFDCPLFRRDSHNAGTEQNLLNKHKFPKLTNDDLVNLAEAIIEGAVEDWKALQYGALEFVRFQSDLVTKKKTLKFFFSKDFENFLGTFSERTPEQIRSWLKITEDMRPVPPHIEKMKEQTWQQMMKSIET